MDIPSCRFLREDYAERHVQHANPPDMVFSTRPGSACCFGGLAAWLLLVPLGGAVAAETDAPRNWLKPPVRVAPPLPPGRSRTTAINRAPAPYRYRLAPGDRLTMSVFKIDGYEASVQVLSDGTINLPRLGTTDVWGLTLEEARQRITAGYSQILRRPLVYLNLVEQRPIRVTVTGEVTRPGVFTLQVDSQGSKSNEEEIGSGGGWPTMVNVIQKAGGVSALGDLSRLELLRPSPQPGGQPQRYVFDYLTVLQQGGQAPNPLIYDGDSIRVHRAQAPLNTALITTASSNFAPTTIQVNVVGQVFRPGLVEIRSNAPLSQAILASGGVTRRGSTARIDLIRMDSEGQTTVRQMAYSPSATLSSPTNPPLRHGDVVVVDRNTLTKVTDGMNDALLPLSPIVNAASVFRLLGLPTGLNN